MTNSANGVPLRHSPGLTDPPDQVPPRCAKAVVRADAAGSDAHRIAFGVGREGGVPTTKP